MLPEYNNAALFIDYENIYYHFKTWYKDPPEISVFTTDIFRTLKQKVEENYKMQVIVMNAYADFERIGIGSLGSLYLMGIATKNVMGNQHKNAADMQMCIDLMEALYLRSDIKNLVIVAGDRDYIPVVQHLKRQGKDVYVAAFRETLSGDLLEIISEHHFIDLTPFIDAATTEKLNAHKSAKEKEQSDAQPQQIHGMKILGKVDLKQTYTTKHRSDGGSTIKVSYEPIRNGGITKQGEQVISCILNYIQESGYQQPGLTPLLRYLTDEMPLLANWERKALIEDLRMAGVYAIATKSGSEYDFSVLVMNYDHPKVRELMD